MEKMKRKRICKYGLIAFSLVITISLLLPTESLAFKNYHPQKPRIKKSFAYSVGNYMNDYKNNEGRLYYGTHDWFAERSLEVLYEHRNDAQISAEARIFISRLYDLNDPLRLRYYYLLGTEAVDVKTDGHDDGEIRLIDCNGEEYGTIPMPRGRLHNDFWNTVNAFGHTKIHFTADGCDEDKFADVIQSNFENAIVALQGKDCQKAAFFLGAVMHSIGDIACYPHMLKEIDFDTNHRINYHKINGHRNSWESRLNYLTCKIEELADGEFFSLTQANEDFGHLNPWSTAKAIALDTGRYVYINNYHMDLWWAYYNNGPNAYFPEFNDAGKKELFEWDQSTWQEFNSDQTWYFGIIQDMFNRAVLNGARILQIASEKYTSCECSEGKKVEEEKVLKPRNLQLSMDKFFLYLAIAGSTIPFILLSKFLFGKAKGFL